MTALVAAKEVDFTHLRKVENLINATGRSVFLEEESLIDAVTALSGSGPAYFFYIVKAMIEAGKNMGFDESLAALLVKQTMLGSFHLIQTSDKSLDELIKAVASKGGTTEAALKTFDGQNVADGIIAGIEAAQQRAVELSK
jgi:pyrroline-5-carboxylate reductase